MAFFKNNKNKTVSAAPSPAQTPRTSMQGSRPAAADNKVSFEQAMEKLHKKACIAIPFNGVLPVQ